MVVKKDSKKKDETTAPKPRLSRLERLQKELEETQRKEQAKAERKLDQLREKQDSLLERRDKINAQLDELHSQIRAAQLAVDPAGDTTGGIAGDAERLEAALDQSPIASSDED